MKRFLDSVLDAFVTGVLLVIPVYLAVLLLIRAMKSLAGVIKPIARFLPKSFPAVTILSLVCVLLFCLLLGLLVRTRLGHAAETKIENSVFRKIPGYEVMRGVTRQLTGRGQEGAWQPALVEIENALVPAFIVEEIDGGCFTVFVPSSPTLLAGAVYILTPERVHPLDVPFAQAVMAVTRWGAGSRKLVEAMHEWPTLTK